MITLKTAGTSIRRATSASTLEAIIDGLEELLVEPGSDMHILAILSNIDKATLKLEGAI